MAVQSAERNYGFDDRWHGWFQQDVLAEVGDFILLRADGYFAYQLAVVVDDHEQGITDVVRGGDLLDSTPRQIVLQQMLGYSTPRYLHVPVITDSEGRKLSKQNRAEPVDDMQPGEALRRALAFLGYLELDDVADADLLRYAVEHWRFR